MLLLINENPSDRVDEINNINICKDEVDLSVDENNIFRDLTLKFSPKFVNSHFYDQEVNTQNSTNQLNLTSFILALDFQMNLIQIFKDVLKESASLNISNGLSLIQVAISCFNKSYFLSLKLNGMLSFKILISKIFGFNHESSLANFSIWLNSALTGIHSICFEIFFVENLAGLSEPIQITTNFINNYDLSKEVTDFFNQNKLDCTEDTFKIIAKYLVTFRTFNV